MEMSVLERQRFRQKWQQPVTTYFGENCDFLTSNDRGLDEMLANGAMKPDPGMENGWSGDLGSVLNYGNGSEFEIGNAIPRTVSCPPNVAAAMAEVAAGKGKGKEAAMSSAATGRESFKKRKADRTQSLKVIAEEKSQEKKMKGCAEEKSQEKKMKGCAEEESKITDQNSNSKSTTTTARKGPAEFPKPDYIHVRARRGQATDSHSLAERVRREKISERMKYLQDLVPGCNKITGKAGMLDEIINYVQSLQRQVEFLSMKLAAINPRLDFDMDNYLAKEIFLGCTTSGPTIGVSSDMVNPAQLQFNPLPQGVLCSSSEMCVNPTDATLRRTISAPVSIPETFLDSPCLNQIQQLTWDAAELQNLYSMECQQGRSTSFISQPLTGFLDIGQVKMEM